MRTITTIGRDVFGAFFILALASQTPLNESYNLVLISEQLNARLKEQGKAFNFNHRSAYTGESEVTPEEIGRRLPRS
jgi:hypothetical protein